MDNVCQDAHTIKCTQTTKSHSSDYIGSGKKGFSLAEQIVKHRDKL